MLPGGGGGVGAWCCLGGGAVLYCSGGWCCPGGGAVGGGGGGGGVVQWVLSRKCCPERLLSNGVLFRGRCYSGGGAIQGLVLSITESDIITFPINRMTDRET